MAEFVQITDADGKIGSCSRAALPIWEARGYKLHEPDVVVVDAPTNEDVPTAKGPTDIEVAQRILDGAADDVELLDPSEKTVGQVVEHLATADDVEVARVIAAEAAGKNRKGIVTYGPPTIVPAQTTDDDVAPGPGEVEGNSTAGDDAEQQQDQDEPAVPDLD